MPTERAELGCTSVDDRPTYDTRVQSKIHSLVNLAAARATCRLAAAARRSQARGGAQPTQDAGLHPWREENSEHDLHSSNTW